MCAAPLQRVNTYKSARMILYPSHHTLVGDFYVSHFITRKQVLMPSFQPAPSTKVKMQRLLLAAMLAGANRQGGPRGPTRRAADVSTRTPICNHHFQKRALRPATHRAQRLQQARGGKSGGSGGTVRLSTRAHTPSYQET